MSFEKPQTRTPENPIFPNLEYRRVFDGKVDAYLFGRHPDLGELGWSLRNLQSNNDVLKPENLHLVTLLRQMSLQNNVNVILAPSPSKLNGVVCTEEDLVTEINIGTVDNPLVIKRGFDADGVEIKSGEAYLMTSADCSTVIAEDKNGKVIAAHGGRNSIFNIEDHTRQSLVDSILDNLDSDVGNIKFWTGFAISPGKHFAHDESPEDKNKWPKLNQLRRRLLTRFLAKEAYKKDENGEHVDVMGTSFAFAKRRNVLPENFVADTSFCTYLDKGRDGKYKWYSHRRQTVEKTDSQNSRNAVLVIKK